MRLRVTDLRDILSLIPRYRSVPLDGTYNSVRMLRVPPSVS